METIIVKAYGTEAADAPFHGMKIKRSTLLPWVSHAAMYGER